MRYKDFEELVGYKSHPITHTIGKNEDGESVIMFARYEEDYGVVYHSYTSQSNGWIRHNIYYPDGTVEELYSK